MHLSDRLGVAWALARRETRAAVLGRGLYVALSLVMLAALVPARSYASQVDQWRVLVAARPFDLPLLAAVIVAAGYLGLSAAVALVRDFEHGTMETLFFGPVDAWGYLAGSLLAQTILAAGLLACFGLYLAWLGIVTGLAVSWGLLASLLAALWSFLAVISFGILVGAVARRTRVAILLFLLVIGFFAGLQIAAAALMNLPAARSQAELAVVASVVSGLYAGARWLSPFSYLLEGLQAAGESASRYLLTLAEATLYAIACVALAVFFLRRRGARP